MSTLSTTLGLRALPPGVAAPNHASTFLILNFMTAYILGPRLLKIYHKMDHNVSPRYDSLKYGPSMVSSGKLSQSSLDMILRWESAHANAVENYTLFVAAALLGSFASVDAGKLNGLMAVYTGVRVGYLSAYVLISKEELSVIRTAFWWTGNVCCLAMLVLAGRKL